MPESARTSAPREMPRPAWVRPSFRCERTLAAMLAIGAVSSVPTPGHATSEQWDVTRFVSLAARRNLLNGSGSEGASRGPVVTVALGAPSRLADRADVVTISTDGSTRIANVSFDVPDNALLWAASSQASAWLFSAGAIRRPLIDESVARIGAATVHATAGLRGQRVAIGIIDTGIDLRHVDFRRGDGSTRVAWLLDLERPARGVHADLERAYGIERDGVRFGAVWSATDIDTALREESRTGARNDTLPNDTVGHGTFVASIAAGQGPAGAGGEPSRYAGVAPDATLVIVRATYPGTRGLSDAAILRGAAFADDRARALGQPLVLNLSVGSHHGAHDGTSALEVGLAALFADDRPGRAIVVAAGNDAREALHARFDVTPSHDDVATFELGAGGEDDPIGIDLAYEGVASFAVEAPNGERSAWFGPLQRGRALVGDVSVAVANATTPASVTVASVGDAEVSRHAEVVLAAPEASGALRPAGTYRLHVRGNGTVHAWISTRGRSFARARFSDHVDVDFTLVVPATSRSVVTVGAVVSRTMWTTVGGRSVTASQVTDASGWSTGEPAPFSARGPTRNHLLRPDLVAPGAFVFGALSRDAPVGAATSHVSRAELVAPDSVHGGGAGASAAAPHVAGAFALLLQADPTLAQRDLRAIASASARVAPSQNVAWTREGGFGEVAVDRAVELLRATRGEQVVDTTRSTLAASVATIGPGESFDAVVRLVDAEGRAVAPLRAVRFEVDHGEVTHVAAPRAGLYVARVRARPSAPAGSVVELRATVSGDTLRAMVRVAYRGGNASAAGGGVIACGVDRRERAGGRRDVGAIAALIAVANAVGGRRRGGGRASRGGAR